MRKIEAQMLAAIRERKYMHNSNTVVSPQDEYVAVLLHGNLIARVYPKAVVINNCGWSTATTKSRLHNIIQPLCGAYLGQSKYQWFITLSTGLELQMHNNEDYTVARKD